MDDSASYTACGEVDDDTLNAMIAAEGGDVSGWDSYIIL